MQKKLSMIIASVMFVVFVGVVLADSSNGKRHGRSADRGGITTE